MPIETTVRVLERLNIQYDTLASRTYHAMCTLEKAGAEHWIIKIYENIHFMLCRVAEAPMSHDVFVRIANKLSPVEQETLNTLIQQYL